MGTRNVRGLGSGHGWHPLEAAISVGPHRDNFGHTVPFGPSKASRGRPRASLFCNCTWRLSRTIQCREPRYSRLPLAWPSESISAKGAHVTFSKLESSEETSPLGPSHPAWEGAVGWQTAGWTWSRRTRIGTTFLSPSFPILNGDNNSHLARSS